MRNTQMKMLSLFLLSASVIAFQLLLIQSLSITQWHHFASLIISVALLGFGASGTFLTLFRKQLARSRDINYFRFITIAVILMVVSYRLTQTERFAFDSYLVFSSGTDMFKLLQTYLLLFFPFFSAAIAIGLLFSTEPEHIGNLYAVNLTGSAAGGIISLILLQLFTPPQAIALLAVIPLIAALLLIPLVYRNRISLLLIAIASVTVLINIVFPPQLYLSEYKSISKVLNLPETVIVSEKSSPYGLLQVVSSPYVRYAPGLSLNYQGESSFDEIVFNNGIWLGPLYNISDKQDFLSSSTLYLPFIAGNHRTILVPEAGAGENIKLSIDNHAESIIAVESNAALIRHLTNRAEEPAKANVYRHHSVRTVVKDAYGYLLSSEKQYDLILLPLYDAFGGVAGIGAVQENKLLTGQSFSLMWNSLSDEGMISVSAWIDNPLRYPLRITATIVEMLEAKGIAEPAGHIIAIRNWSLITYLVTKEKVSENTIQKVQDFCEEMGFDILLLSGVSGAEREKYHLLSDKSLLDLTDSIINNSERSRFYHEYLFKINPVSSVRPFPFRFIRVAKINELLRQYSRFDLPYLEIGFFILLVTFFIVLVLASLLIVVPLLFASALKRAKTITFVYFLALGVAYMMVEIVLIHRFIPYLGNPVYASSVIISGVLLFSGLGSKCSSQIVKPALALLMVVLLIVAYAFLLNPILNLTIAISSSGKMLLSLLIIAPLAFFMGFPFPLGISYLNRQGYQQNIPWAWGINGSISVISSILALIIAVEFGFTAVKLIAALFYTIALLTSLSFSKA